MDTKPPPFSCGIALHPRTMALGMLHQDGEIVVHRTLPPSPEALLQTMAPSREHSVLAIACLCTGYGRAARCARAGRPCVWGHALSRQASHGGTATHDPIAAHTMAVLLRGGLLPQADGSPAQRRAPRARRRRRRQRRRKRAALLTHVPQPNRQDTVPALGTKLAYSAHRAVWRRAVPRRQTAQPHEAQRLYRRQAGPGMGPLVRWGVRDALQALTRCPRVPDGVAAWRLGTGAKASAGTRSGPSGAPMGQASLPGAGSEAAVLVLRHKPLGHNERARWEPHQGQGQAVTILAPPVARAGSALLTRAPGGDRPQVRHGAGRGAGEPHATLAPRAEPGMRGSPARPASEHVAEPRGPIAPLLGPGLGPLRRLWHAGAGPARGLGAAPPPPLARMGAHPRCRPALA